MKNLLIALVMMVLMCTQVAYGYDFRGFWHLYPTGVQSSSTNNDCNDGCPSGYEYESIVSWDGSSTYFMDFRVNANAYVQSGSSIAIAQMTGKRIGSIFRIDRERVLSSSGWSAWNDTNAAMQQVTLTRGIFNYHYELTEYPYEYGILGKWTGGANYARLWRGNLKYYMSVMREGSVVSFMRGWNYEGVVSFDVAMGHRSGLWYYADEVYELKRDGEFHLKTYYGYLLKWRLNISTGQFDEWWSGSATNPNSSYYMSIVTGASYDPVVPYSLQDCRKFESENYCPACNNCNP